MRLTPIPDSSNLAAVGHEGDTLVVRFRGGSAYRYTGVPEQVFRALLAAPSKGAHFAAHVARNAAYAAEKLTQAEADALDLAEAKR